MLVGQGTESGFPFWSEELSFSAIYWEVHALHRRARRMILTRDVLLSSHLGVGVAPDLQELSSDLTATL